MKFAYFGYDFMLHAVQRLIKEGHELTGVFTFPCDNIFNFNKKTIAMAHARHVPCVKTAPQQSHIDNLVAKGTEIFVAAGYVYKIPPIDENKAYGINLHPSYLPKGRGMMPTPYILMGDFDAAGITIHKLTPEFDQGDILLQERFHINEHDTVESYSARVVIHGPEMLSRVFQEIDLLWRAATPQEEAGATYYPAPTDETRLLDFTKNVDEIAKIGRAFGRYGCIARFDNQFWIIYDLDVWADDHELEPGEIACRMDREIVIAAKNGFVCMKDFHKVQAAQQAAV